MENKESLWKGKFIYKKKRIESKNREERRKRYKQTRNLFICTNYLIFARFWCTKIDHKSLLPPIKLLFYYSNIMSGKLPVARTQAYVVGQFCAAAPNTSTHSNNKYFISLFTLLYWTIHHMNPYLYACDPFVWLTKYSERIENKTWEFRSF